MRLAVNISSLSKIGDANNIFKESLDLVAKALDASGSTQTDYFNQANDKNIVGEKASLEAATLFKEQLAQWAIDNIQLF